MCKLEAIAEKKDNSTEGNVVNGLPDYLSSRCAVYSLLGELFYSVPAAESPVFGELDSIVTYLSCGDASLDVPGLSQLLEFVESRCFASAAHDFQQLFVGPGNVPVPPWESVYLGKEKLIFDEPCLEVRSFYCAHGLKIEKQGSEPDDHVGLELQFMALLSKQLTDRYLNGEYSVCNTIVSAQKKFLDQHLLLWVDQFSELLSQKATSPLYRGLASFLPWYLTNDAEGIASLDL